MYDKKYCYPDSDVLINKFNIRDKEKLNSLEREFTFYNVVKLNKNPIKGDFDIKHLKNIHYELFKEIYNWAGELRTVDIEKGYRFCSSDYIEEYSKDIFKDIKKNNFLIDFPREKAIKKLAEYMGDINAVHPFREGNGRTQRTFISNLANVSGFDIAFSNISKDEMLEASISSFSCNYEKFEELFTINSRPLSIDEQEKFIKNISNNIYNLFDNFRVKNKNIDRENEFYLTKNLKYFTIDFFEIDSFIKQASKYNIPFSVLKELNIYKIVFPESHTDKIKSIMGQDKIRNTDIKNKER